MSSRFATKGQGARRQGKCFSPIRFCPCGQVNRHARCNTLGRMSQPKLLPKLDLTRVNFYSFSGDPRPDTICTREEVSSSEHQDRPSDEGFSVLMSALRRSQVGTASQTFASRRKFSAKKN
jgi:hypothetical protein